MSLFSKKKKVEIQDTTDAQKIAESLYKQNLEIANKNKTLALLGKLYETSILTLEPKELALRIAGTIQADLGFEIIGIFLYSEQENILNPLAVSTSTRLHKTEEGSSVSLKDIKIARPLDNTILKDVIEKKVMGYTEKPNEIWTSGLTTEFIKKLQSEDHLRSSVIFPLITENKTLGILVIGLNRMYADLFPYEKESIQSFVNVIAVALDKTMLYAELEIANKGQENLIHVMNHQIKGFLGKAKNIFAELLQSDDYGHMPEEAKSILEQGLTNMDEGVSYVQGILRGASAQKGTLPYDMKPIDVKAITVALIPQQKEVAEKSQFTLSFESSIADGDYKITGDEIQLSEAFKNLITNGIKYNSPKGSIKVTLVRNGDKIVFAVKDAGDGVSEDVKPRLFTAGGISKDSVKKNPDTSGYGLAFVRGVAEAHGGTVGYKLNSPERGSQFYIELPVKQSK